MFNVNVAVIGGGITASLVGYLSRHLTSANLDMWESEAYLGGRMKTMQYDQGQDQDHNQLVSRVDIGAQYITTTAEICNSNEIYLSLLKSGKIANLVGEIVGMKEPRDERGHVNAVHYVAPQGMQSIVGHFVNSSNFRNIYLTRPVRELNVQAERVEVMDEKGRPEVYDAAVLTLPIPEFFKLRGNLKNVIPGDVREKLQRVEYSCRDCLVLFFDDKLPIRWAAKYLPHDPVFRYVAIQENKVGLSDRNSSSAVVFHTSIQFGEKYKTTGDETTKSILIEHARRLFPNFPQPVQIRHHKWNHSQVVSPYERGADAVKSVVVCEKPLVIIAGDAFATSNFDGCIISAQSAAETLKNYLLQLGSSPSS